MTRPKPAWLISACVAALVSGCGGALRRTAVPARSADAAASPVPASLPKHHAVTSGELADYVGSERCITCHRKEAQQVESHHARTLRRSEGAAQLALFRTGQRVRDPKGGAVFQPTVTGDRPEVDGTMGSQHARVSPLFAFGSGNRCFTYVGATKKGPVELPISYYRRGARWDLTPGQQPGYHRVALEGRPIDQRELEDCLLCHSTTLVKEFGQPRLDRIVPGVGCEVCHGAGRAHVEAVQRHDPDLRMMHLAGSRDRVSTEICGQCHRVKESGDPHDPQTRAQAPRLQGLALSWSKCFERSGGKLSCVTCHDPHRNADAISRAEYNRQCVACHRPASPPAVACRKAPAGDCVSCHMPAQSVNMPTRPVFRTHWIKIWSQNGRH